MKQKYEGKDLQGLVDLGREQGYLTFEQVNDYLPQDVASPTDVRAALDSFEDLDIKVLEEVPTTEDADNDLETEPEEEPEQAAEAPAHSLGGSSDPVARPTCATSSRRTKSLPTPMRSVGARPTKSNSNSCPPRPPSSSRCTAGSKSSRRNSRSGPSRS
jgi:hypothetical protein